MPRRTSIELKRARPAGLEPTTPGLEGRCSIQLSYGHLRTTQSRGGRIRTDDLLRPRQTRYQTALRPVFVVAFWTMPP